MRRSHLTNFSISGSRKPKDAGFTCGKQRATPGLLASFMLAFGFRDSNPKPRCDCVLMDRIQCWEDQGCSKFPPHPTMTSSPSLGSGQENSSFSQICSGQPLRGNRQRPMPGARAHISGDVWPFHSNGIQEDHFSRELFKSLIGTHLCSWEGRGLQLTALNRRYNLTPSSSRKHGICSEMARSNPQTENILSLMPNPESWGNN